VDNLDVFPEAFRSGLGFPFYKSKDDVLIELDPAYGPEMVGDFNLSVAMLAQKMADTVKLLRAAGEPQREAVATKGTLFLSETSWDREPERRLLETELTKRGYAVVPERSLSSREAECEAEVAKLLADSKLAIHIIGSQPGMVPSGPSQKSVDVLQNEMASQLSKTQGLRRIVWIPQSGQMKNPAHQQFIETLTRNEDAQFGADVVTGDFELLKSTVLGALRKLETSETAVPGGLSGQSDAEKLIYVICDRHDTKTTIELRKSLRQRGFDPQRPLFEGDASAVRKQNDTLLNLCRAVILYYGAGDEAWFRSTIAELEKVRRRVPVWTYVAGPATSHKQEILDEFEGGEIINGLIVETPEAELDRMLAGIPPRGATS
jgi:hypothetical protein